LFQQRANRLRERLRSALEINKAKQNKKKSK
jgi:hypothetical protein